jgi:ADP-heptose:LPS heptosyltransferase
MDWKMINTAILINGGFGTVLVRANFMKYFISRFSKILRIDIYGHPSNDVNRAIFGNGENFNSIKSKNCWNKKLIDNYDLIIQLDTVLDVQKNKIKKSKENQELISYLNKWEKFKESHLKYYKWIRESKPYLYKYLIGKGKNIFNSLDLFDDFNVGDDYVIDIPYNSKSEKEVLKKFDLLDRKYITIQYGANPKIQTAGNPIPKLWPSEYFEQLIPLLKTNFEGMPVIQLGEKTSSSTNIEGVDQNLLGKTSFDEVKIILKNSFLHIDSECGLVHLRKALHGGPSVVLFGPTCPEIFGYKGNLNLRDKNACPIFCAETSLHWETQCPRNFSVPPCMTALTPKFVMNKINNFIKCGNELNKENNIKNEEILNNKEIKLNKDWASSFFKDNEIYGYEFINLPLKKIKFQYYYPEINSKWIALPLIESPVYKFLLNDTEPYFRDQKRRRTLADNPHSLDRLKQLIKNLTSNGFDEKNIIVIDADNKILDGYHRASWLLYKYGQDHIIRALRLYGNFRFLPYFDSL